MTSGTARSRRVGREILLLRHGEEPRGGWSPDLSNRGQDRAQQLAQFIPDRFGVPDLLVAAAPNGASIRCYLTLRPLAWARDIPLFAALKSVQAGLAAAQLLDIPIEERRRVVVCWTHHDLPALARALGAASHAYPDPWPDSLFDIILRFRFGRDREPAVTMVQQPLLAGRDQ